MKTNKDTLPDVCAFNPRSIAQAHYILSVTANRLLKMAIHKFDIKKPKPEVKFSFLEYFKAYHMENPGAEDKRLLKMACKEIAHTSLEVEENYMDGGFRYVVINMVSKMSAFLTSWGMDELTIKFTDEMATLISEYKNSGYYALDVEKFGKLGGKYEQRLFEIAMSYRGLKDEKTGLWFFAYSIAELREVLKTEKLYPRISDFREKIIEKSIKNINETNIGVKITTKKGKNRLSEKDQIFFSCHEVFETDKNSIKTTKNTRIEPSLREKYPEQWQKFYEEEKQARILPWETLSPDAEILIAGFADEKLAEQMKNKPKGKLT
jgi:plasmid replication initiation protein